MFRAILREIRPKDGQGVVQNRVYPFCERANAGRAKFNVAHALYRLGAGGSTPNPRESRAIARLGKTGRLRFIGDEFSRAHIFWILQAIKSCV
jgi:hypothetical protein